MADINDDDNIINVRPVTPQDWPQLIAAAICTPIVEPGHHPSEPNTIWCPPINTIGLSGIGKSVRIKAISRSLGLPGTHVVYVATKNPSSFEGAAVPTPNGIIVECTLPAARKCISKGGGLIFFDEANGATPRTQAACLSTLNDRQVGDHVLPPQTRMLLAMNPPEHAAGGFALAAPMANRMGHVWYPTPTKQAWGKWLNGIVDETPDLSDWESRVLNGWDKTWGSVNALAQGFIHRSSQDVFVNQPEPDDPQSGQAWPSYRMWHWAFCALTSCRCIGLDEQMQLDFVHAYCGVAASIAWATWTKEADLPSPEEMITQGWSPDTHRIDVTYAALNNVTSWVINMRKEDPKQAGTVAGKVWGFLDVTLNTHLGDLTADCAAKLHNAGLGRQGTPADTAKIASDVILRLTKAGLTKLT